ncbi:MAG: hypothetical protein ACRC6I_20090 [Paracoccaceae bacterium]
MAEALTAAQMAAHLRKDEDFAEWYVEEFMKDFLPQYYFNVSDAGKRRMVTNGRHYAQGYGLTANEAQAHFITLMWEIGANFDLQPGFRDVLARGDLANMDKINHFFDGGVSEDQAVFAVMHPDDRFWHRDVLARAAHG